MTNSDRTNIEPTPKRSNTLKTAVVTVALINRVAVVLLAISGHTDAALAANYVGNALDSAAHGLRLPCRRRDAVAAHIDKETA